MLTPTEKYLFDTLGFVVLRNVVSRDELALVNAGIEHNRSVHFHQRTGCVRNSKLGHSGRIDCGNCLSWSKEDGGDVLRNLLINETLAPVIQQLCGTGYRMDHKPVLFLQPPGTEGFDLHGGAVTPCGKFNFPVSYHCRNGDIVCNLVNAAVQLTDTMKDQGGFVVIPGSHKSNFAYPSSEEALQAIADTYGMQPECQAGDVVLFTEAVLHGAAIRKDSERRVALFRFSPATCAYARGYTNRGFEDFENLLTEAQKKVAQPPFHLGQDRLGLVRPEEKREFDKLVFGNEYY